MPSLGLGLGVGLGKAGGAGVASNYAFYRDFRSGSINGGVGGDLTYTRTGTATYWDSSGVLQTASANTPRFDHKPDDNTSLGILMEVERTNLIQDSQEFVFASTVWSGTATITDDDTTSPDGTVNGTKVTDSSGSLEVAQVTGITIPDDSNNYCLSIFVKKRTGTPEDCLLSLRMNNGTTTRRYDVSLNVVTGATTQTQNAARDYGAQDCGDWWRLYVTGPNNSTGNTGCSIHFYPTTGAAQTDYQHIYGAQLEVGNFISSYIPTSGATATRGVSTLANTSIGWYNSGGPGTLLMEASLPEAVIDGWNGESTDFLIGVHISNGSTAQRVWYVSRPDVASEQLRLKLDSSPSTINLNSTGAVYTADTPTIAIAGWSGGDSAMYIEGSQEDTDALTVLPTGCNQIHIGSGYTSARQWNGHIQRVIYWNERLLNGRLATESA